MLSVLIAAGVAIAPPSNTAAPVAPPVVSSEKKAATQDKNKVPGLDDFAKMMAVFDKVFPAGPEPEPARLARARSVAVAMWPDGTYGMLFESFATAMTDAALDMKPSELAMFDDEKDKKKKAAAAAKPDITLREEMRLEDPHFDKRMALIKDAVHAEVVKLSPIMEPPLREGLSRALARRFTESQLAELGTFYATPTGQLYAREFVKMWFDADIMRASMNSMPMLVMQMPAAFERVKAAADSLPQPPKKAKPKS